MSDWLTWPAELLLSIAGIIASCFVSKTEPSFDGIRTMIAILLVAAIVGSIVCGQSFAEFFPLDFSRRTARPDRRKTRADQLSKAVSRHGSAQG